MCKVTPESQFHRLKGKKKQNTIFHLDHSLPFAQGEGRGKAHEILAILDYWLILELLHCADR